MPEHKKEKWYHLDGRGLSNLIVVCVGVLLYLGLTHLPQVKASVMGFMNVLSPFIGGFVIAYLLNSPAKFLSRTAFGRLPKRWRDICSVVAVYLLAFAVILILLQLILPQLVDSVTTLAGNLSGYLGNLNTLVQDLIQRFHLEGEGVGEGISDVMNAYNDLLRQATQLLTSSLFQLLNIGVAVGNGVVTALTALISSIYMMTGKERLIGQLKKLTFAVFPAKGAGRILNVCSRANTIFADFINGKLLDSAIIGVLCFILTLIFRIPYAVLVSVVIGVTNIIPFFGPIIGAIPCLMLLLMVDPWAALRFGFLIVVLQQFDGNILGPKILGNSTGLSAMWVLVAIVVGGGLFGFAGMLLGVPTFAVLYALVRDWANERLAKKGIDANGQPLPSPEEEKVHN